MNMLPTITSLNALSLIIVIISDYGTMQLNSFFLKRNATAKNADTDKIAL